jgi:DNA-binding winged helix-turn-helix (wHTH) protein/tetratricopeptide (TPR) repeat protein
MTVPKPEITIHPDGSHYSFGPFCLSPDGTLLRETDAVHLPPKELAVLRVLISHPGQIVSPEQLHRGAWGDVHVSADSLPRCVSSLRAHLEFEQCIQTIYKRGYRFTLPVQRTKPASDLEQFPGKTQTERRATRPTGLPRLAILPFATASDVPAFLGPGIAEETMIRLARIRNPPMEIMARDSVFHLAACGASAQEVGAALGADLVVAGSMTALPLHYRLRIETTRVADAVQLWVEDFLVPRHLLACADTRTARHICARIRNAFATAAPSATSAAMIASNETRRSEAYTHYLAACAQSDTLDRSQLQGALRGFQHALELDPNLLDPQIRLVHGFLAQASYGYLRGGIAAELARNHAEKVLSLSAASDSLYSALGWIHFHHDRDTAAAADAFARPQPSGYNPWNVIYQLRFALGQGRFSEAASLLHSALETDPYSPVLHGRLAWTLHLAGDSYAALGQAKRTQKLFPDHPGAAFFCAIVFAAACRPGDSKSELATRATALATKLVHSVPSLDAGYATLAYVQARQGCILEARAILDRQQALSHDRFVMRSFHAPALVELGEFDAAMEALVTAEKQHCPWLFELLVDPRLQPLHSEPEFQRLSILTRQMISVDASVA